LPLIILLLVYKQDIEIVDLPFGRNYSNLTLSVFDQKSGVTSKITEESLFTELIDTTISTLTKLINLNKIYFFIFFDYSRAEYNQL
jgi:predicted AlkP superfamily phosphohydrolase/phosphomutase